MNIELKRLTVSVSPSIGLSLEEAKKEQYRGVTQSDMIRDLIVRGLESVKQEKTEEENGRKKTV